MHSERILFETALALLLIPSIHAADSKDAAATWTFAVSGDSRNCGDVVMPAIAADATSTTSLSTGTLETCVRSPRPDQDFLQESESRRTSLPISPTMSTTPGTTSSKTRSNPGAMCLSFSASATTKPHVRKPERRLWLRFTIILDRPEMQEQRLKDDPKATEPQDLLSLDARWH